MAMAITARTGIAATPNFSDFSWHKKGRPEAAFSIPGQFRGSVLPLDAAAGCLTAFAAGFGRPRTVMRKIAGATATRHSFLFFVLRCHGILSFKVGYGGWAVCDANEQGPTMFRRLFQKSRFIPEKGSKSGLHPSCQTNKTCHGQ